MDKLILAISTLIGTIIGGGIFGIPFVISKSGFAIGLIHIILIAIITGITMLYLGEIALRTKRDFHLTGYANRYLGGKGKYIMLSALGFGITSAIIAYLIGIGDSLSYLFFENLDFSLHLGIAFWIFLSLISYHGLKALKEGEFIGVSIILALILSMVVFFFNKIDFNNLAISNIHSPLDYLAPFGVILFAFLGYATIPEVKKILKGSEKKMKKSIIFAIVICTIVYILFAATVIGFKGFQTPEIATFALGKPFILLGILAIFTSYLAVTVAMIDMIHLDFNQSRKRAWVYTTIIPLIFYIILKLADSAQFTKVLGIGGAISGGITGILIISMVNNAKIIGRRKPEYSIPTHPILTWILIIIFVLGTLGVLINTI